MRFREKIACIVLYLFLVYFKIDFLIFSVIYFVFYLSGNMKNFNWFIF